MLLFSRSKKLTGFKVAFWADENLWLRQGLIPRWFDIAWDLTSLAVPKRE